ncbi:uncharacterized protein ASPGLDRAFT_34199 [Aspergillus glaucus CBS 516.65]|uniref:HNH nuclease domain-containing protein n=1 Tax=Aspergillus glaucus CBS 516.65 TaxID=1160497 RepID=A0A1L9VNA5_ASPGL|nr:hypothetical protein ASPGLDRAFT_34199 [Aspergillus glaucus CBS 516.65]OJJ85396.1 hypothetical protein ASPGLDRAFT_34199 [Aspergillus glaucus CBS 516.65]
MDVALYRPNRVRLVSQLEEKLGLKDAPIPALSRAILWLCDLDRLQEMVSNPDTEALQLQILSPHRTFKVKRIFKNGEELDDERQKDRWSRYPRKDHKAMRRAEAKSFSWDDGRCFMERTGAFLESTYIFGDDDAYGFAFWDLVSCCVSDAKVNAWRETVERGSLTQRYDNIITTSSNAHLYWDAGLYALKHIEISDDQKTMKVQFFWKPRYTWEKKSQAV